MVDQRHSFKTFLVVWFGQTMSMLGTGLTAFGIIVWIFLETGSLSSLAVLTLAAVVPRTVLAPFAGAYVDRWSRRTAMIVSDAGSGAATVALAVLFLSDNATLPSLAVVTAVSSAFAALQWPAYQAAVSLLVPKDQLSRAQGLMQLSDAASRLIPPAMAAVILAVGSVGTLIVIDVVTFLVAVGTLLAVKFPEPPPSKVGTDAAGQSVLADAAFGFVYIRERAGWQGLLGVQLTLNVAYGFTILLVTAYVLTVSTEQALGAVNSIGASGLLLGAIAMTAWKGSQKNRVRLIILATAGIGLPLMVFGVSPTLVVATAMFFLTNLALSVQNTTYRALWQAKVEPDVQGRVFSARMMIVLLGAPLAFVLIGPLMEYVFEPLSVAMLESAPALASLFGDQDVAPYRAFLSFAGLLTVAAAVAGWAFRPLRNLEAEIPDFDLKDA